ncbi:peptidase C39 [Clostridia bacterium]|nr:peptidase C39 [Clostridia bacterium]
MINDKGIDEGLYCLISIAKFHGINADGEQLKHNFAIGAEGMSTVTLLQAAKTLSLKSKTADIDFERLQKMQLPAVSTTRDGHFFIIAQAASEKVMLLHAGENAPKIVSSHEFCDIWSGRIILFVPRQIQQGDRRFGFKWFIPTIIKYKKPLIEVLAASFILQILGLFSPIITQVVMDKVLVHNSLTTLDVLAIALIAIAIFELILGLAKTYVFTHTVSRIDVVLGDKLFSHLFRLPLRYFETRRVGDTVARVRELDNIRAFLTGAPLTALLDTLFIFVYIIIMFFYSVKLTVIVICSLPAFVVLSAIVTPIFRERLDERFRCGAESQSFLVETVTGVQTIKSFALEPQIQKRWDTALSNYVKASFKTAILSGNSGAIGQAIQKLLDLAILWIGAKAVMDSKITVGQLIAFRMMASRVSGPVLRLVQTWQDFQQANLSVQRLGDIFNTKTEPLLDNDKARLPAIKGYLRFEKVNFRYRPDTPEVIRDMSFEILPGTIVGIVGRSGSGKSTISKLIQRLYFPEAGKIIVDGTDISLADPAWLRRQIGIVLQENFLFNMSIKENICVHKPTASIEDVIRVSEIAGAHGFISELPEGYNTMVGEKGTGLSGGQKQRIAIARALLGDPKILIFDEATSALDYESESIIQKNLLKICKGRTVLIIAHRLSTLKEANKIMAIDRGVLVEYGAPEELLANKNGLYHHLYTQQLRGDSD